MHRNALPSRFSALRCAPKCAHEGSKNTSYFALSPSPTKSAFVSESKHVNASPVFLPN